MQGIKSKGVLLSPIPRKIPASTLYTIVRNKPPKITLIYESAISRIFSGVFNNIRKFFENMVVGIDNIAETIIVRMIIKAT